jgi:hypothetical protein
MNRSRTAHVERCIRTSFWYAAATIVYASVLDVAGSWMLRSVPNTTGAWDTPPSDIFNIALETAFFASFCALPVLVTLLLLDRLAPRSIRRVRATAWAALSAVLFFAWQRSHGRDIALLLVVPALAVLEVLRRCTRWRY